MIAKKLKYFLLLLVSLAAGTAFGQELRQSGTTQQNRIRDTTTRTARSLSQDDLLDTMRKQQLKKNDTVIYTSKFIKVTTERLMNDSTQLFPLDTTLTGFENYSPLYQPYSPRIGIGNLGLDERSLLFEPSRTIGFDVGLHTLDAYLLHPQDIQYYRARTPFTSLYLVAGGLTEQVFKVVHTQNIRPNWNIGINFNRIGSYGVYARQHADHLGAAFFSWYESKDKRYNLLANLIFNNLKAPENGSITDDSVYTAKGSSAVSFDAATAAVRLNDSRANWRDNGFYLKQTYYLGRIDSSGVAGEPASTIRPTQKVGYTFYYNVRKYKFQQDEADAFKVFPDTYYEQTVSRDSLAVLHLQNEFSYSFYLRGKSVSFVKNEAKLDLALTHDYYSYSQWVRDTLQSTGVPEMDKKQAASFQDITLKAKIGYRFSDRIGLNADFQQITLGHDFGDYLYDASINLSGGRKVGKIIIEAYTQNSSPPLVYTSWVSNHFIWQNSFKNTKTTSAAFSYINDKYQFGVKAEYFLINNYLYFGAATTGGIDATPMQVSAPINLLKVTVSKNLQFGRWHFDNIGIYQKSDYQTTLRTPDFYLYSSLFYNKAFFDVLNTSIGINVRYNTPYVAPSYAVGLGQFYNGPAVKFSSYPTGTVYLKATLKRTNLFLMYDYFNQGLLSSGYYTVNRYPMPNALLKYGVLWNFYN